MRHMKWLVLTIALGSSAAFAEQVNIGHFSIDRTEVTVTAFAAFADQTGLVTQAEQNGGGFEWGAGWERRQGWTFRSPYGAPAEADEPAVHVSFAEAEGFRRHVGGRLPTRIEWEDAAYTEAQTDPGGGFETGRTYP